MQTNNIGNQPMVMLTKWAIQHRGLIAGLIILASMAGIELFNFSTTQLALSDFLGPQTFIGIPWSMILAIAFCGIDFAGIIRILTPQQNQGNKNGFWYIFGAWLLAATMNTLLTWWGITLAMASHASSGSSNQNIQAIMNTIPVTGAIIIWLSRVLLIGSLTLSGANLFSTAPGNRLERSTQVFRSQAPEQYSRVQPQPLKITPLNRSPRQAVGQYRTEPQYINDPSDNHMEPAYYATAGRSDGHVAQSRRL